MEWIQALSFLNMSHWKQWKNVAHCLSASHHTGIHQQCARCAYGWWPPEDDIVFKLERSGSAVAPSKGIRIQDIRKILAWENSRHLATLPLVFSPNDVWETRAEIPYWWRLGSASDWLNQISHAARPIRSTTQIWVVTRHQYGISALVSQTPFGGKTSGSVANSG